jgi:hypothetical protein
VPAMGEGDIGVVDALVGLAELLALLERHIPAVTLLPGTRNNARWPGDDTKKCATSLGLKV